MSDLLFETKIPGGWGWSHIVKRGTKLRIQALEDGLNMGMLCYAAWNNVERYNMADSLKAQHISGYSRGNVLYSDMGRVLLSVIDSSLELHDATGGMMNGELSEQKFGTLSYQEHRNDYIRNAYSSFLAEISKYGMGRSGLVSNVNWFSRIDVGSDGTMSLRKGNCKKGDYVELRAEMDTLVVMNSCPHHLDTDPTYNPADANVQIYSCPPAGPMDVCRTSCEENIRGFINTETWHL